MKLPERIPVIEMTEPQYLTQDQVNALLLVERLNQLIDYLAEREEEEDHTPDRPLNNERE
jgi:hypothetical protein